MVDFNFAAGDNWCRLNITSDDGKKYDVALLKGHCIYSHHDEPMDFAPFPDAVKSKPMFEKLCFFVSQIRPKFVCDSCVEKALAFALEILDRDGLDQ